MRNEEKIILADTILQVMERFKQESTSISSKIGTLEKAFGLKGFKTAEIGESVFEYKDRYILYLESLDGKTSVEIPFYKNDLSVKLDI